MGHLGEAPVIVPAKNRKCSMTREPKGVDTPKSLIPRAVRKPWGDTARHTGLRMQTLHKSCSNRDDDDDTRGTWGIARPREHFGGSAASSNMLPKHQKTLMHPKKMFSK